MLSSRVRQTFFMVSAVVFGVIVALASSSPSEASAVELNYSGFDGVGTGDFRIIPEACRTANMSVEALPANVHVWHRDMNGPNRNIQANEGTYSFDHDAIVWTNPDPNAVMREGFSITPGEIRLRFSNAAELSDGSRGDVVVSMWPSVRLAKDPNPGQRAEEPYVTNFRYEVTGETPFLLAVVPVDRWSLWISSGFLTDVRQRGVYGTVLRSIQQLRGMAANEACGLAPQSDTSVVVKVCKHGTSEVVSGNNKTGVFGLADIDYPDYSVSGNPSLALLHDGELRYNSPHTEGVRLENGFVTDAFVMPRNTSMGVAGNHRVYNLINNQGGNSTLLRTVGDRIVGSHITDGVDLVVYDAPQPPGDADGHYIFSDFKFGDSARSAFVSRVRPEFSLSLAQSYCGMMILGGARTEYQRFDFEVNKELIDASGSTPFYSDHKFHFRVTIPAGSGATNDVYLSDGETYTVHDVPVGTRCEVVEVPDSEFPLRTVVVNGIPMSVDSIDEYRVVVPGVEGDKKVSVRFENRAVSGGVRVIKHDMDLVNANDARPSRPQGDASLDGAVFEVRVSRSGGAVTNGVKWYDVGDVVTTIRSALVDGRHVAATSTNALPYGKYELFEITPPKGYNARSVDPVPVASFSIDTPNDGKLVNVEVKEPVRRGPFEFDKTDVELGVGQPQGDGLLSGAEFDVKLKEGEYVFYNGHMYGRGETVCHVVTDSSGHARINDLPYGTYLLYETKAPFGYMKWSDPVEIVHRP